MKFKKRKGQYNLDGLFLVYILFAVFLIISINSGPHKALVEATIVKKQYQRCNWKVPNFKFTATYKTTVKYNDVESTIDNKTFYDSVEEGDKTILQLNRYIDRDRKVTKQELTLPN